MATPTKKQFDYYVTNLNWGDGTPIEYVEKPKLFDRSFNFEHNYERPGFYTVTGLVYKYSLLMVNAYPPASEDLSLEFQVNEDDNNNQNDDMFGLTVKNLRTIREEEQYLRFNGFNISDDAFGEDGSASDGLQYTPSSLENNGYRITKTDNSATNVTIYTGANKTFSNSVQVQIGSSGGNSNEPFPSEVEINGVTIPNPLANRLFVPTRTRPSGARINVNVHMDSDNNNLFEYKFDAWLPNFGRHSEASLNPAPTTSFNPPTSLNPPPPPDGYLQNTSGNAQTIEPQPPQRGSQITSTYNLEFFDGNVGTTTGFWGGEGAWVVTDAASDFAGGLYTWSPNLNAFSQYTQNGVISDDGLWQWVYTGNSGAWVWQEDIVSDDGLWLYDGSQWNWQANILSDDQQWIYDGTAWIENPDFDIVNERDPVNNPTRYLIRITAAPPVVDEDGNDTMTVDWGNSIDVDDFVVGTNSWETYTGQFYARTRYVRLNVDVRQLDHTKDYRPMPDLSDLPLSLQEGSGVEEFLTNVIDGYGAFPWSFYIKNIEMNFQNNSDLLFPLQWEKFKSNFIVNPKPNYNSPLYEKNNFLLIGGLSKDSFHFKTLASLVGYDFESLVPRENFNFEKYNPYDVITALDTLAKYDSSLYNEYLNPYVEEVYSYGQLIHNGVVNTKWHGTFENTELKQTDIGAVKMFKGVKPMWQQLGFSDDKFDRPNKNYYWNNIHKDGLEERDGIIQRDLPDPKKGALTPRIPRKEFIVDEESSQEWNSGGYWPNLPKFNKLGVLSDVYPPSKEPTMSYGNDNSSIESIQDSDSSLIFELGFDDELTDNTENFQVKLNTDFKLIVDDNGRISKEAEDFSDAIETKRGMPY